MTVNEAMLQINERIDKLAALDADLDRIKWTLSWSPTLAQMVKLLATRRRIAYSQWLEQLIIESLTEEEWDEMVEKIISLTAGTKEPKA